MHKGGLVFLLTSLIILGLSSTDIYISSLPQMANFFHTTVPVINMTLSSFTIGLALGSLVAGVFSDRFGRRNTLLTANLIYIIVTFAIAFSPSIYIVIVLRFIQAFVLSANTIVPRQIIKDIFDVKEQVGITATMLAGVVLSPALAPVFGAHLAMWFDWQACFTVSGFLGLILLIWLFTSLKESNSGSIEKMPTIKTFVNDYYLLCCSPRYLGYLFTSSFSSAAYFAFISASSYVYIRELKVSPTTYSYVYIFLALSYLVGSQATNYLNNRQVSVKRIVASGNIISLIGGLVALLYLPLELSTVATLAVFTLSATIVRGGMGLSSGPIQVLVMNDYPELAGQGIGLLMSAFFLFQAIAVTAVSVFHENPATGLAVVTIIFLLLQMVSWQFAQRSKK